MLKSLKRLVKKALYVPRGVHAGENCRFRRPWFVHNPDRITVGRDFRISRYCVLNPLKSYGTQPLDGRIVVGDDSYIGGFCQLHAMDLIKIGDGCVLSEHVYISDIAHGFDRDAGPIMKQPLFSKGPVIIGDRVFIGYGCSVLPGVTIGDNCIVGTRSVVSKSVPADCMVAGSPARIIKRYDYAKKDWVKVGG